MILQQYEQNIVQFCKKFKFPLHVEATAIVFFKRFFLYNSIMLYDITHVMYFIIIDKVDCQG